MRQLDWLADARFSATVTHPPRARRNDPPTSKQAAIKAEGFSAKHESKIFGAIHDAGAYGATYREIAESTGMEPVAVGRRLSAMGKRGVIKRNGQTRGGCCVWCKA